MSDTERNIRKNALEVFSFCLRKRAVSSATKNTEMFLQVRRKKEGEIMSGKFTLGLG